LSSNWKRHDRHSRVKHALLGSVCVLGLAFALGLEGAPAATAKLPISAAPKKPAEEEPFGKISGGPIQIIISIDQQKLHLYSNGHLVTETLIASGVPGHLTPIGVFNIIEKDRYHHSNIYSGAPMPYMQRITWSGVALHEGVGVGHQASHGCVRMPQEFAIKLWALTKLGARVIIAKPELKPVDIADSHLFVHKDRTTPTAANDLVKTAQSIDDTKKSDAADPIATAAKPELRPAVPADDAAAATEPAKAAEATDAAKTDPVVTGTSVSDAPKAAETSEPAKTAPAAAEAPAKEAPKAVEANPPTPSTPVSEPSKPAIAATPEPTPEQAAAAAAAAAAENVQLPLAKPLALTRVAPEIAGPISIFVNLKDKKIYVRQHFWPLFEGPVTITDPDKPLGTHVFTALEYVQNGSSFRWNVVTFPQEKAAPPQVQYVGWNKKAEPPKPAIDLPQSSPQEALARIEIPKDVIEHISELITPGSSLVISDQTASNETTWFRGTDFILTMRQ